MTDLRRMHHLGPPAARRISVSSAAMARCFHLRLPAGRRLLEAVIETLGATGIAHAGLQFHDGTFTEAWYQTAGAAPPGSRQVIGYGPAKPLLDGARLVTGNATLGRDAEGQPLLHCHATLVGPDGHLVGGHLPTERCIIGIAGIGAWVTVPADGGFRAQPDEETGFTLFQPTECGATA